MMDWFEINSLRTNPEKFQYMVVGANKNDCFNLNVAIVIRTYSLETRVVLIEIFMLC